MLYIAQIVVIIIVPIILVGLINRTKAIWAGRKGFPILQLLHDLIRLSRKSPVISSSTSWIFEISAVVLFGTTLVAAALAPMFPGFSIISFEYDFVLLAYLFALGRILMLLGALDTGSAFEGMGASREAAYSAMIEPVLFMALGTLSILAKNSSMNSLGAPGLDFPEHIPIVLLCGIAIFILLQTETCRVPIDDPNTHLELTMIHEVMTLDHSGFDLALIHYATAIKMTVLAGFIASILNPFLASESALKSILTSVAIMIALAVLIGLVESMVARIKLSTIPRYLFTAIVASVMALVVTLVKIGMMR